MGDPTLSNSLLSAATLKQEENIAAIAAFPPSTVREFANAASSLLRAAEDAGESLERLTHLTVQVTAPAGDDSSRESIQYDLGQATMSMMLAAADLGVGSAHAAVTDQELARSILGFPEDKFCAWLIALGYPSDRPLTPIKRPTRRPFQDVVHRGAW